MVKDANDILQEMNNYPYYLFLSDLNNISPSIAKLPWSCVLTTETDLDKVISVFQSEKRKCKCIFSPEDFENTPIKKKQLTIVFLCGTKTLNSVSSIERIAIDKNISKYFNYIPSLLSHFGYLLFDTWKLNAFTKSKVEELFFSLRNDSISIYNYSEEFSYSSELIVEKKISLCEYTLIDFFKKSDLNLYDETSDEENDYSDSRIDFFINKKRISKDKNRYSDFLDSFYLMTEQEINKIHVSSFLVSNFFYQFLQNSAYSYEWYGYSNGFNFKRDEDDHLFTEIKNRLRNPSNNNTYLIYGQSGSGKTIAINNIAYRIFKEKEYPVIFLKNSQFDFFKNTDNYSSVTSEKIDSNFSLLDEFMHDLEDAGSKNILLVWDLSLPSSRDYANIYLKLSKFLHNRGRNFVLLCSGYTENNNNFILSQIPLSILTTYSNSKVQDFLNYIEKYADFSTSELKTIYDFFSSSEDEDINLFYIFYRFFYIVKPVITKGIKREAEFSIESVIKQCSKTNSKPEYTLMQLAMIKAGIMKETESNHSYVIDNDEIRKLLIITAICCKFNLSIPSDLALRLLTNFDLSLIKAVTNIPFFRFTYDDDGDYSFSIRSQLEANILLQALNISKEEIINYICILIKTADLTSSNYKSNKEVKCIADLLHRMGPNSNNPQEFMGYFQSIISELKQLHSQNRKIDIKIIVIEINYIREYYRKKDLNNEINNQDFNKEMNYIISLGDSYTSVPDNQKDFNYNMIKIEIANARYYMFNKNYTSDIRELYIAKKDAESVFNMYGDYSYNIWFKTCIEIYKKQQTPELLVEMINLINVLHSENKDIDTDIYMAELFNQVYSLLKDSSIDYIDSLITKGNSAGLYLKVMKKLTEHNLKIDSITNYTPEIETITKDIFSNILTNERYSIIIDSLECLLLVIKLKWILYNHASFTMGDKQLTKLTTDQWNDISSLCEKYLLLEESTNIGKSSVVIEYLQALCFAQTEQYTKANELLQNIKIKGQTYAITNRVYARHMLCNERGEIKYFTGRIELSQDGKCRIIIPEFSNNRIYLHCKDSNLKNINIEDGKVDSYFQIGIGIMGLSVYHGYKDGRSE